jgi:WhiA C-terminal HTH domain
VRGVTGHQHRAVQNLAAANNARSAAAQPARRAVAAAALTHGWGDATTQLVCRAVLACPGATLAELAQVCGPTVTKDVVSGRLRILAGRRCDCLPGTHAVTETIMAGAFDLLLPADVPVTSRPGGRQIGSARARRDARGLAVSMTVPGPRDRRPAGE